jgi:hypothetical protein
VILRKRVIMKTVQIMKRDFMGREVRQRHNDQYFCVNDITAIANKHRKLLGLPEARWDVYAKSEKTKEFFEEIIKQKDIVDIVQSTRGKGGATWAHPLVFFDYAMWLSPEFKVKVYDWMFDCLTIYRDESGDSYKRMCSSLCSSAGMSGAKATILIQDLARAIKRDLSVDDWNKTTPDKLKKRDGIHRAMEMLLDAGVEPAKAYKSAKKSVDYDE